MGDLSVADVLEKAAPFAALTLTLYIAVAVFGPRRVRIPLMLASLEDWWAGVVFGLVVLALVRL